MKSRPALQMAVLLAVAFVVPGNGRTPGAAEG